MVITWFGMEPPSRVQIQHHSSHQPGGMTTGRQLGRVGRKRRRKRENDIRSVSLSQQPHYVKLMKFLHQRGFRSHLLQPTLFTDTGRGLRAVRTVKPGQLLISLPESCLLTTSTVLDSDLGPFVKSWRPVLSPLLALCVFLMLERHRGEASDWSAYIGVLPASYTCPAYFADDVMALLPAGLRAQGLEQREAVRDLHSSSRSFFRSIQPLLKNPVEEVMTYEALRWAWCSVNTRSVFMPRPQSSFLSGQDVYALAPFLDLLNHRPDVQVEAGFDSVSGCYEIRSVGGTLRRRQAFINYGSHDNQRLLLEYGFVAAGNPHSVVYVDPALLSEVLAGERALEQKMKFLRENGLHQNLTVSSEGPSWRLLTALRMLSLPQTLYHQWKAAALGQQVCEERDRWAARTAERVCRRLLRDTHSALDEISRLLVQCDPGAQEQLAAVQSLRLEESCILGNCLDGLRDSFSDPWPS